MGTYYCNTLLGCYSTSPSINNVAKHSYCYSPPKLSFQNPVKFVAHRLDFQIVYAVSSVQQERDIEDGKERFKWLEVARDMTEEQKRIISKLPPKMMDRCKAFIRQIICYAPEKGSLEDLLAAWVRIMKPTRADWLAVIKQLKDFEHPFYIKISELVLLEESFEANIRDYTKIIHYYGKLNQLQDAEHTLSVMKSRGFIPDQVTLTAMVNMYSKAGNLELAEQIFEEIKIIGESLDNRSYGSMVMAYVRAKMFDRAEILLREMDVQEIYAGKEVYKALLREYSMIGDSEGAQRVFEAIQLAGIFPDVKLCALLINAYKMAGQNQKAVIAFQNMRKAGLEPDDKCVALVLAAFEKDSELNEALSFLMELERDGIMVGKEASGILAVWFKRIGVLEEVELVLREYAATNED
ncbi:hypothetical protein ACFE04_018112 [Oxalis oulophora]